MLQKIKNFFTKKLSDLSRLLVCERKLTAYDVERFTVLYFRMHNEFCFNQIEYDWYIKFSKDHEKEFLALTKLLYESLPESLLTKLMGCISESN
ncbi:MAG: hypothetical protein PHU86_03790 [Patescibacteria group bacterium]|nr:hypothetical protein [Patescibacteria group bacterium]